MSIERKQSVTQA